ncbi:MAG: response regulator, partial [Chloroflexota bacterium]
DNRLLIKRVLMFEGYDIMFAENAIEALVAADDHTFDLILMDINLPDIDGYALTSQLRQLPKFNSVPIIALTANVMKGDRERSLEAGCDGYIQKPINIDTLPGQIKEYLVAR